MAGSGQAGGGFAAEEGLKGGVDPGREPSIQAVDGGVKRRDFGAYFLAELGQVRVDGFEMAAAGPVSYRNITS